jgi:hypothetical protein
MRTPARARYSGYRFPAEIIGHAVCRMVEELLAGPRHHCQPTKTVRQLARKFGRAIRQPDPSTLPRAGDKWQRFFAKTTETPLWGE